MFIEFLKQRQLNSGATGEGGSFVALEDIDAEEQKENLTPDEIKAQQDANKTPEDLEKAAAEQAAADQKKIDEEEAAAAEAKKKKEAEAVDPPPADPDPEDPEGASSFWDDVDKLRGEALEVDFGDVDPETPEGALIYEKAVRANELNKFEQYLETAHPRAYAYLAHIMDGGTEEDFFKTAGEPGTLPTEAELEADIEQQKAILTRNLKAKGVSDKSISTIIKTAITEDDLEEQAKAALKEETDYEAARLKEIHERTAQETATRQAQIKQMTDYVGNVMSTGKLDNITIPEKDRLPFAQAVNNSIRYENGKFLMVTELNQENVIATFKEKFFSYKKGDLKDLIQQEARTQNTNRLKRQVPEGNKKPLGSGQKHESAITALGEMDE
jgi:hypothetical protein